MTFWQPRHGILGIECVSPERRNGTYMNPYPRHVAAVDVDFVARVEEIDVGEIRGLSRHPEQVFGSKSKGRSSSRYGRVESSLLDTILWDPSPLSSVIPVTPRTTKLYYLDKQWQDAWRELQRSDEAVENFITRSYEIRGRQLTLFFFVLFMLSYFYQRLSAGKSSLSVVQFPFLSWRGGVASARRGTRLRCILPMTLFFFPSVFNAVYLTAD